MRNHRRNTGSSEGLIAIILVAIVAMPILGVFLLTQKNKSDRRWGVALAIIGIILWILIGIASA